MRKSVTSASAKNVRSLSVRGKAAALATTVLLAGAVQLAAADSSWACGDYRLGGPQPAMTSATEGRAPDTTLAPAKSTVATDGSWNEVAVKVTNKTGADVHGVQTSFGIHTPGNGASVRTKDVRIQWFNQGTWKDLTSEAGCYRTVDAGFNVRQRVDNNTSVTLKFRYALNADTPQGVTKIQLLTDSWAQHTTANGATDLKTINVSHAQAKPTAKPSTTQKPAPKPTTPAKAPAAAKSSPAAAPATKAPTAAPTATAKAAAPSTAPATTAPAGTPELAHTGAGDTPKGFLTAASAAFVALGAGVLIAVRRLRPQR